MMLTNIVLAALAAATATVASPINARQYYSSCTPDLVKGSDYIIYQARNHSSAWNHTGETVTMGPVKSTHASEIGWGIRPAGSGYNFSTVCIVDPRTGENYEQKLATGTCGTPEAVFQLSCNSCDGKSANDCTVSTGNGDCITADGTGVDMPLTTCGSKISEESTEYFDIRSVPHRAPRTLMINTPASFYTCEPAHISWSGGTAPYYLSVIPGGNPSATPYETLATDSYETSFKWKVNLAAVRR
ncbi:hypothetical protein RQP46_000030 [Phenoliferia psychrophenolica]